MLDIFKPINYNKIAERTNVRLEEIMETRFVFQTLFEILVAGFIIYGLIFEDRFVAAEKKAFRFIKRRLRLMFSKNNLRTDP